MKKLIWKKSKNLDYNVEIVPDLVIHDFNKILGQPIFHKSDNILTGQKWEQHWDKRLVKKQIKLHPFRMMFLAQKEIAQDFFVGLIKSESVQARHDDEFVHNGKVYL